jgi:hypothetical protein
MVLNAGAFLDRAPFGPTTSAVVNRLADRWRHYVLRSTDRVHLEELKEFDSSIDNVIDSSLRADGYWCSRSAEFLNWRYVNHPRHEYAARIATVEGDLSGYSVTRFYQSRAHIMEFVAPGSDNAVASALLRQSVQDALDAGCQAVDVYATRNWRFWPLFRRAGFMKRESNVYISARCDARVDIGKEENWQLLPGDSDVT